MELATETAPHSGPNAELQAELDEHIRRFKEDGYTIFPKLFSAEQMQGWIELFARLQEPSLSSGKPDYWFGSAFELAPELMLPAVANPQLLDFAERIIGPFVQLDNLTLVGFPALDAEEQRGKVGGWHRDRWGKVPNGIYERPLAFNAICYFQDLDEKFGPLRILPGSHIAPDTLTQEEIEVPHRAEKLIHAKAGDVICLHNSVIHSGTPNISGKTRFFFSLFYNMNWLKSTDDHSGTRTQEIIAEARARKDFRTMRLFGEDEQLALRCNSGFLRPAEETWAEWITADRAALIAS